MTTTAVALAPLRGYTRANSDEPGTPISFVASTSGVKRDGYSIDLAQMSLDNFRLNPVFLWVHDYYGRNLPIGRVTKIEYRKRDKVLLAQVVFDQDDEFALKVESKYRRGFLNAVSIGWIAHEFDEDSRSITASELLELSGVPVPGDSDALMERQRTAVAAVAHQMLGDVTQTGYSTSTNLNDSEFPGAYERLLAVLDEIDPESDPADSPADSDDPDALDTDHEIDERQETVVDDEPTLSERVAALEALVAAATPQTETNTESLRVGLASLRDALQLPDKGKG